MIQNFNLNQEQEIKVYFYTNILKHKKTEIIENNIKSNF